MKAVAGENAVAVTDLAMRVCGGAAYRMDRDGLELFWTSLGYCHCNFTALDTLDSDRAEAWVRHLLRMEWNGPQHRTVMELEGVRRWVRPELEGYRPLFEAVEGQRIAMTW